MCLILTDAFTCCQTFRVCQQAILQVNTTFAIQCDEHNVTFRDAATSLFILFYFFMQR